MFNPLTAIDAPYDGALQFLHNLPAYNVNTSCDELLDLSRVIQESGAYYWTGVAIPNSIDTTVPALGTINGSAPIPEGSYITAINFFFDPVTNPEGFKFKLYDEGTKASIFYGEYALERTVASNMDVQYGVGDSNPPSDQGSNIDNPFGQGFLMNPLIITKPGILGWEIVNQSSSAALIQMLVCVAVPANKRTASQVQVTKT